MAGQKQQAPQKTMSERDREDEERYDWRQQSPSDSMSVPSVICLVSRDREELAGEFFDWLWEKNVDPPKQLKDLESHMNAWEVFRFGAALCPAAHGIVWYAIRAIKLHEKFGEFWENTGRRVMMETFVKENPRGEKEGPLHYAERIARLGGYMAGAPIATATAAQPAEPKLAVSNKVIVEVVKPKAQEMLPPDRMPFKEYEEGEEPAWAKNTAEHFLTPEEEAYQEAAAKAEAEKPEGAPYDADISEVDWLSDE
jgi:hypothetical protein